jgi:hypothetical protein
MLDVFLRGATPPANFHLAIVTNSPAPTVDTNTLGELTEIPAGNGYTAGGQVVARNNTDWPTLTEDDALDRATAIMASKVWTASGGTLPSSGDGFHAVLTDANGTLGSREVLAFWSFGGPARVSAGQTLTVPSATIVAQQGS